MKKLIDVKYNIGDIVSLTYSKSYNKFAIIGIDICIRNNEEVYAKYFIIPKKIYDESMDKKFSFGINGIEYINKYIEDTTEEYIVNG